MPLNEVDNSSRRCARPAALYGIGHKSSVALSPARGKWCPRASRTIGSAGPPPRDCACWKRAQCATSRASLPAGRRLKPWSALRTAASGSSRAERDADISEIDHVFEGTVQDAFLAEPGVAIAADRSGRVLRDRIADSAVERLRPSVYGEELLKILPAHNVSLFWALRKELTGNGHWALTLYRDIGESKEIFRIDRPIWDVAISPDAQVICLAADAAVQVLRHSPPGWQVAGSLPVVSRHIAFVEAAQEEPGAAVFTSAEKEQRSRTADEAIPHESVSRPPQPAVQLLVTAQATDRPWLEIWDVSGSLTAEPNLVRKAAAGLPGIVTCLAAAGNAIAIGFTSARLATFYYENAQSGAGAQSAGLLIKAPRTGCPSVIGRATIEFARRNTMRLYRRSKQWDMEDTLQRCRFDAEHSRVRLRTRSPGRPGIRSGPGRTYRIF